MATVDIVNRALSKLGEARLTSLDDPVKAAGLAKSLYDAVVDSEMAAHSWNFAKARLMLPAEAERPPFGWPYQYILPQDCLRVLSVGDWPPAALSNYINADQRLYTLEGGRILSRLEPPLPLIYIARVTDSALYPAEFKEALAAKLAVEMVEDLSGSTSKREMAWREYDLAIRQAKRVNAIALPPLNLADDSWLTARQLGGY